MMNYQNVYNSLIEKSLIRGLNKKELTYYTEKHHIVPRCMNGPNDKSNLVLLTGREHYLAHWLLWKIHRNNNKLFYAYTMMVFYKNSNQDRDFKISSKQYQILKENTRSKNNPMYGRHHTNESRKLMSINCPNRSGSNNPFYGKMHSDESKLMMHKNMPNWFGENNPFFGKKHSDETKHKMRKPKSVKHTDEWKLAHSIKMKTDNPRSMRCMVDDQIFVNIKAASVYTYNVYGIGINKTNMLIKNNERGWCLL